MVFGLPELDWSAVGSYATGRGRNSVNRVKKDTRETRDGRGINPAFPALTQGHQPRTSPLKPEPTLGPESLFFFLRNFAAFRERM